MITDILKGISGGMSPSSGAGGGTATSGHGLSYISGGGGGGLTFGGRAIPAILWIGAGALLAWWLIKRKAKP